jgi:hypothetical protein
LAAFRVFFCAQSATTAKITLVQGLVASSLLFVVATILRHRSTVQSNVFMIPTGGQSAVLIAAHRGGGQRDVGWGEVTFLGKWPDPRFGWWSGRDIIDVGPFLIHGRRPASFPGTYSFWERIGMYIPWDRSGTFMVPKVAPDGPVAYENAYRRAQALGFPNSMPPPPQTVWVTGWQWRFPMGLIQLLTAILPAIFFCQRTRKALRRRQGHIHPICATCGYDLRATPHKCPECGTIPPPSPPREERPLTQADASTPQLEETRRKRIARRISRGIAVTSSLLCLCTAIIWVRSEMARDTYTRCASRESSGATTIVRNTISWGFGDLAFGRLRIDFGSSPPTSGWTPKGLWDLISRDRGWRSSGPQLPDGIEELGLDEPSFMPVQYTSRVTALPGTTTVQSGRFLVFPLWLLLIATAAWPAWQLSARLRRRYRPHPRTYN